MKPSETRFELARLSPLVQQVHPFETNPVDRYGTPIYETYTNVMCIILLFI